MQNIFITVYKNDYKKEEKHPDYKAYTSMGGKLEQIGAGWLRDKNGKKYISFSIQAVPLSQALKDLAGITPQAPIITQDTSSQPQAYQTTLTPEQVKEIQDARNAEIKQKNAELELANRISTVEVDFENF